MTITARHFVEATDRGSRATLSLQFTGLFGALVGRMTRGLNNRYLNLEATGLKPDPPRAAPTGNVSRS